MYSESFSPIDHQLILRLLLHSCLLSPIVIVKDTTQTDGPVDLVVPTQVGHKQNRTHVLSSKPGGPKYQR